MLDFITCLFLLYYYNLQSQIEIQIIFLEVFYKKKKSINYLNRFRLTKKPHCYRDPSLAAATSFFLKSHPVMGFFFLTRSRMEFKNQVIYPWVSFF